MEWLTEDEVPEWDQDPLVEKLRLHLARKLEAAKVRLRTQSRQGQLEDVRRAEQRVTDFEEFIKDITPKEQEDE